MPRHPKSPNDQRKPINPRKQAIQTARKRESRGRIYLAIIAIAVIAIGVGWYVYSTSQSTSGIADFAIAAPTGITIHAGSPATSKVNVTAVNNFGGTVQLSATGSSGLSVTISPANVTGSGVATLTMSTAANGTYTVTVTGTSGTLKHTVTPVVDTPVYAALNTSNGTIVVELYRAQTPQTVTNFVNLANQHFYDNLVWHRLSRNPPVIQTGDPNTRYGNTSRSTWGTGGSPQTIPLELDKSLHNSLGYLGMARGQALDSGSSQFYINMANNNDLDTANGGYTVFGKVLTGMSAANAIWNSPTDAPAYPEQPLNPVYLISVTIFP
jgi:cyclophilin family peptidyl-prolyl cis-trans isomerase